MALETNCSIPPPQMADSRMMEAALGYAGVGLRVVPLAAGSKRPLFLGWKKKATAESKTIQGWPRHWFEGNLGILMGDGIIAVDIDPRNGGTESLRQLIAQHETFPPTAEALTGSGGEHFLFRVPKHLRIPNKNHWRPGIDIKSADAYIVVEPSRNQKTGKEYVWKRTPQQVIAEAPAWLLAELAEFKKPQLPAKATRSPRPIKSANESVLLDVMNARFAIPRPGYRHSLMCKAVGSLMGRELKHDLVSTVMMQWWEHFYDLGKTSTSRDGMKEELDACIKATARNDRFRCFGAEAHRAECRKIQLTSRQKDLIKSAPKRRYTKKTHTASRRDLGKPNGFLCHSSAETAYVEALIVLATYNRAVLGNDEIKMTDEQITEIAKDRQDSGWKAWDKQQRHRLKSKFVDRPKRAASWFSLLKLIEAGASGLGEKPRSPSVYETTGIESLLEPEARRSQVALPQPSQKSA